MCCLSSLNIETWDEWHEVPGFIEDVLRMLDNVLTHFITTAPDSMERARYSALRERSGAVGRTTTPSPRDFARRPRRFLNCFVCRGFSSFMAEFYPLRAGGCSRMRPASSETSRPLE